MKYTYAYRTDMGNTRKTNQDALLIKTLRVGEEDALLLGVFDGLGGLAQGEKMSRWTATLVSDWFDCELPQLIEGGGDPGQIERRLVQLLDNINSTLYYDNQRLGISGGTTISVILFWAGLRYIMHVGDSRIYEVREDGVRKLTTDHSYVAREVRMGRMTEEEARRSPKQNVLLQCLGPSPSLSRPEVYSEAAGRPASYVLCTDGFWHSIWEEDLLERFAPSRVGGEPLGAGLEALMERAKRQGEKDNITAVVAALQ